MSPSALARLAAARHDAPIEALIVTFTHSAGLLHGHVRVGAQLIIARYQTYLQWLVRIFAQVRLIVVLQLGYCLHRRFWIVEVNENQITFVGVTAFINLNLGDEAVDSKATFQLSGGELGADIAHPQTMKTMQVGGNGVVLDCSLTTTARCHLRLASMVKIVHARL